MNICLETSSLFPLFVYTSYSIPLYKECAEILQNNGKVFVYKDSINEALQISLLSKTEDILNNLKQKQITNRISLLRHILEYFPGHTFGNNSSRAISLFILDLLDDDSLDRLDFQDFKLQMINQIKVKRSSIIKALTSSPLTPDPSNIFSYWLPVKSELLKLSRFEISVLQDMEMPSSTKNKERDLFHFKQAISNPNIEQLIVCDSGFKKQLTEITLDSSFVKTLSPYKNIF